MLPAAHSKMSGTNASQSSEANLPTVPQPKSSNVRKRSFNGSSASQQEEGNDVLTPPLKRPAVSSVSTNPAKPKKLPPWDATGHYQLICTSRYQPVDTSNYSLQIYYQLDPGCQIYTTFKFGALGGMMRLCPQEALISRRNAWEELLHLQEFENACVLGKEQLPGPKSKGFLMRWRGKDGDASVGGETRAQGQFIFKDDPSSSVDFRGTKIVFAMIHKGKHLLFEGTKTANMTADHIPTWTLEEEWKSLFVSDWEMDTESDLESDGSYHRKPKNPPVGGIIKAKNKPGPNPGSLPVLLSPYIEAPPNWAWDVTGKWDVIISPPKSVLRTWGIEKEDSFSMSISYDNNSRHNKVGRQLWASFKIGLVEGIMRFCPETFSETTNRSIDGSTIAAISAFEDQCILRGGVWPGSAPNGQRTWNFRWRGRNKDTGDSLWWGDETETEISFERSDSEELMMMGSMCFGFAGDRATPFKAFKVAPGVLQGPNAITVSSIWLQYQPKRYPLGSGRS